MRAVLRGDLVARSCDGGVVFIRFVSSLIGYSTTWLIEKRYYCNSSRNVMGRL